MARFQNLSKIEDIKIDNKILDTLPTDIYMTDYAVEKAYKINNFMKDIHDSSFEWYGYTIAKKDDPYKIIDVRFGYNDRNDGAYTRIEPENIEQFRMSLADDEVINGWIHSHGDLGYKQFSGTDEANHKVVRDYVSSLLRKPIEMTEIVMDNLGSLVDGKYKEDDMKDFSVTIVGDNEVKNPKLYETIKGGYCFSIVIGDSGWSEQEIETERYHMLTKKSIPGKIKTEILPIKTDQVLTIDTLLDLEMQIHQKFQPSRGGYVQEDDEKQDYRNRGYNVVDNREDQQSRWHNVQIYSKKDVAAELAKEMGFSKGKNLKKFKNNLYNKLRFDYAADILAPESKTWKGLLNVIMKDVKGYQKFLELTDEELNDKKLIRIVDKKISKLGNKVFDKIGENEPVRMDYIDDYIGIKINFKKGSKFKYIKDDYEDSIGTIVKGGRFLTNKEPYIVVEIEGKKEFLTPNEIIYKKGLFNYKDLMDRYEIPKETAVAILKRDFESIIDSYRDEMESNFYTKKEEREEEERKSRIESALEEEESQGKKKNNGKKKDKGNGNGKRKSKIAQSDFDEEVEEDVEEEVDEEEVDEDQGGLDQLTDMIENEETEVVIN
ncbi:hypothetical protein ACFL1H_07290 [Nanoarchaeota archaeon]